MADNQKVPFGKYKDQPLQSLLADQNYLDWIASQPDVIAWLQTNYSELFTDISRRTDQDSVQHNRLQAKFLDEDFVKRIFLALFPGKMSLDETISHLEAATPHKFHPCVEFECGSDVSFWIQRSDNERFFTAGFEIKPALGDDFPVILRQMKRQKSNVLLIEKFSSAACSIEQVKEIFSRSGIKILFFNEI